MIATADSQTLAQHLTVKVVNAIADEVQDAVTAGYLRLAVAVTADRVGARAR